MSNKNNLNLTEIIKEIHDGVAREMYCKGIDDAKSVILQTLDNEILIDTIYLRLEELKKNTMSIGVTEK